MSTNRSYGKAGQGLGSASANKKFGKNAQVGAQGEREFGKILAQAGLDRKYTIYYSLALPRDAANPRAKDYGTDVDVALANGNKLILVDVKKWSAKSAYWSIFGYPFKGLSPMTKNGKWALSKNMQMALDRFRRALPGIQVDAIVVFIPTSAKGAVPNVGFLRWPGGIKSYTSGDGINRIARFLGLSKEPNPIIMQVVGRLTK